MTHLATSSDCAYPSYKQPPCDSKYPLPRSEVTPHHTRLDIVTWFKNCFMIRFIHLAFKIINTLDLMGIHMMMIKRKLHHMQTQHFCPKLFSLIKCACSFCESFTYIKEEMIINKILVKQPEYKIDNKWMTC